MYIKEWEIPNKNTPQFKVGDIVKILPRNDLINYFPSYVDSMQKYTGQVGTITEIESQQSCTIDLDNGRWAWPTKALQLVTSETDKTVDPSKLKNGDYIKIINPELSDRSFIYLFKEVTNKKISRHAAYHLESETIDVNPNTYWLLGNSTKITYATEKERELLNNALLKEGFIWNDLTKQLDSIGLINVSLANTCPNTISAQPVNVSSSQNSIQKTNGVTNLPKCTQEKSQTETELNLFPTKKHYQLNFNY